MEPEPAKPKWVLECHCVCRKFVIVIVVILIIGAICCHVHRPRSHWSGPKPGNGCKVYFVSGSQVFIDGVVVAVKRDGILLKKSVSNPYGLVWIPQKNILYIEYSEHAYSE